jgi:hypothetical protein
MALLSVEDPACCSRRGQADVMKESFRCCFDRGWNKSLCQWPEKKVLPFLLEGRSSATVTVLMKTPLLLLGREDCIIAVTWK